MSNTPSPEECTFPNCAGCEHDANECRIARRLEWPRPTQNPAGIPIQIDLTEFTEEPADPVQEEYIPDLVELAAKTERDYPLNRTFKEMPKRGLPDTEGNRDDQWGYASISNEYPRA